MTPVAENSLRQAAAFIRGLQPDAAAAMLGRLSADEAASLRRAIKQLIEEDAPRPPADDADSGVELQLSRTAPAPEPPAKPPRPVDPAPLDGAAWLRSLRDADPAAIAAYLSREQPRAIAVVLGYLSPELSAGVLQSLPDDEQAKVVAQLAHQEDADPDSLRVIATGLSVWIDRQREEHQRRSSRVATIRQILAATPPARRDALLRGLADREPGVAAALGAELAPEKSASSPPEPPPAPRALPIDQLERLDGRALAEAVSALSPRAALLALAAAPEKLLNKLTAGLPKRAAAELRSQILRVGPTTLAEIDRAQQALAEAAGRVVAARAAARPQTTAGA